MAGRITRPFHRYPGRRTSADDRSGRRTVGRHRRPRPPAPDTPASARRHVLHGLVGGGVEGRPRPRRSARDLPWPACQPSASTPGASALPSAETLSPSPRWARARSKASSDGQHLGHQILGGALELVGLLADHPLLVVLEVGLDAADHLEVLVALAPDHGQLVLGFELDAVVGPVTLPVDGVDGVDRRDGRDGRDGRGLGRVGFAPADAAVCSVPTTDGGPPRRGAPAPAGVSRSAPVPGGRWRLPPVSSTWGLMPQGSSTISASTTSSSDGSAPSLAAGADGPDRATWPPARTGAGRSCGWR